MTYTINSNVSYISRFFDTPEKSSSIKNQPKESLTALTEDQKKVADILAELSKTTNGEAIGKGKPLSFLAEGSLEKLQRDQKLSIMPTYQFPRVSTTNDGKGILYMSIYASSSKKLLGGFNKEAELSGTESYAITFDPKNPKNIQVNTLASGTFKTTEGVTGSMTSTEIADLQNTITAGRKISVNPTDLNTLLDRIKNVIMIQEAREQQARVKELSILKGEVNKK